MGLADLVQAEKTVSIKVSEYRELIENNTELDMLRQVSNGTAPEVYVRILRKGRETAFSEADREELKAYRDTGITPDRFQVIDEEYRKLSKDNARLTEEKARLFDKIKTLEQKCKELDESGVKLTKYNISKDTQIADLKGSNRDLREELRSKLEEVEGLCSTIQEKTAQIDELESSVKSKQEYIEALEARIRRR